MKDRNTHKELLFYEEPFHANGPTPPSLKEESIFMEHSYGKTRTQYWFFDGIQITHLQKHYNGYYAFKKENVDNVLNLSGRQHNMV